MSFSILNDVSEQVPFFQHHFLLTAHTHISTFRMYKHSEHSPKVAKTMGKNHVNISNKLMRWNHIEMSPWYLLRTLVNIIFFSNARAQGSTINSKSKFCRITNIFIYDFAKGIINLCIAHTHRAKTGKREREWVSDWVMRKTNGQRGSGIMFTFFLFLFLSKWTCLSGCRTFVRNSKCDALRVAQPTTWECIFHLTHLIYQPNQRFWCWIIALSIGTAAVIPM